MIEDWEVLTPSERDSIIENEIMGCPGSYSTDLNASYQVVDEMIRLCCFVSVFQSPDTERTCAIWDADKPAHLSKETSKTVPEAICLASIQFFRKHKK
jgi:hypothetical protein